MFPLLDPHVSVTREQLKEEIAIRLGIWRRGDKNHDPSFDNSLESITKIIEEMQTDGDYGYGDDPHTFSKYEYECFIKLYDIFSEKVKKIAPLHSSWVDGPIEFANDRIEFETKHGCHCHPYLETCSFPAHLLLAPNIIDALKDEKEKEEKRAKEAKIKAEMVAKKREEESARKKYEELKARFGD